jgi:hypothetical protein
MTSSVEDRDGEDVGPARADSAGRREPAPSLSWMRTVYGDSRVRTSAALWLCSKIALLVLAWATSWVLSSNAQPMAWAGLWEHWDASLLRDIAQYGYLGGPGGHPVANQFAFFPGFPMLLSAVHAVVPNWTVAEMATGSIASFFAILGLVQLAEDERPGTGAATGTLFIVAPAAVFLSVGYTESLFLAFALQSWRAAKKGRWPVMAVCAALAAVVRVNGIFLVLALAVLIITQFPRARVRGLAWLLASVVPVATYGLYLKLVTGSWLAWLTAEKAGWSRGFHDPVSTFTTTWAAAFGHTQTPEVSFMFVIELLATGVLVAVTLAQLVRRRWADAAYCALTLVAMVSGTWYESVPRSLLLVWPLWCGLGWISARSRLAAGTLIATSAPLAFVTAMMYLSGHWAG